MLDEDHAQRDGKARRCCRTRESCRENTMLNRRSACRRFAGANDAHPPPLSSSALRGASPSVGRRLLRHRLLPSPRSTLLMGTLELPSASCYYSTGRPEVHAHCTQEDERELPRTLHRTIQSRLHKKEVAARARVGNLVPWNSPTRCLLSDLTQNPAKVRGQLGGTT